jgi:hypothetical protein
VTEYLIYFNQQWVGDHTAEWFRERGPLSVAVVDEMKAAGAISYFLVAFFRVLLYFLFSWLYFLFLVAVCFSCCP